MRRQEWDTRILRHGGQGFDFLEENNDNLNRMINKRGYRGFLAVLALALVFSFLLSPGTKTKKSLEDEIVELKEENLKLKQQIEELNAKIDLLLSRIEKLEKAQSGLAKAGDSFEESQLPVRENQAGINLPVVKVEAQKAEPESKTIVIINEDKKKAEALKVKAEPVKDVIEKAKKLMEEKKYGDAEKLIKDRLLGKPEAREACALLYYLAESQSESGKSAEAAKSYVDLGNRYPACDYAAEALFKAGEIYEKLGKKDEAQKIFQDLVSLYPFSKYANLAEEKLKK